MMTSSDDLPQEDLTWTGLDSPVDIWRVVMGERPIPGHWPVEPSDLHVIIRRRAAQQEWWYLEWSNELLERRQTG